MPCMPACHCGLCANVLACQHGLHANVPACQKHANFSLLHANMPINVPTCYTTSQCFNLACQRAKRLANFSVWCANVPKGMPVFQIFPLQNAKENFCTLSLYKKF